jgi:hypothetical protein
MTSFMSRSGAPKTSSGRVAVIDHRDHGLFARLFGHATAAPVIPSLFNPWALALIASLFAVVVVSLRPNRRQRRR